ncbi:MAG: hypothetical protein ACSHX6_06345 [Akkermansiaceae bacterium]
MRCYFNFLIIGLGCCCGVLSSCGDKQQGAEKVEPAAEGLVELIQHTYDGTKPGELGVYKITADIYDARALPLGEIYSSMEQLEGGAGRKVGEFVNLVNSGEPAELVYEGGYFKVDAIAGENGEVMDVGVDLKFGELAMEFATVVKFGYAVFYEMSVTGRQDRMYVVVVNVVKEGGEE